MNPAAEEIAEQAFWDFDHERKSTGAERDAFKRQLYKAASGGTPAHERLARGLMVLHDALVAHVLGEPTDLGFAFRALRLATAEDVAALGPALDVTAAADTAPDVS